MQSILEEFARGNISLQTRFFKKNSHYEHAMLQLIETEEKLFSALNEQETELLKTFSETQSEVSFLSGIDRFIYGYRLGVLMTMEVFNGKDDLIVGRECC